MYRRFIVIAVVFLLFGIGCSAEIPQSTEFPLNLTNTPTGTLRVRINETVEIDCSKSIKTSLEMSVCAGQRAESLKEKLKTLIEELNYHIAAEQYEILLGVQAEWEEIAIQHCQWEANFFDGGSIEPTWYANCLSRQYRQRINELRIHFCEGNGMTGECEDSLRYQE